MAKYEIKLDGSTYEIEVTEVSESTKKVSSSNKDKIASTTPKKTIDTNDNRVILAPMPGTILKLIKNEGDFVSEGETVLIIEAMKMENEIKSPRDGILKKMLVQLGEKVSSKESLFEVL